MVPEYYRKLVAGLLMLIGAILVGEHMVSWGGLDLDDPVGHEYYGLIMFILGYFLVARWKGKYIFGGE